MNKVTFEKAEEDDLETILDIYNFYVVTTTATFDHNPVSKDELRQRIFLDHEKYRTYLLQYCGETAGFCFLTQFKKKKGYERTAEIGLYLKPEFTSKGIGEQAIVFLEKIAVDRQIKVIIASICSENTASIKLVQRSGYEKCAHYKEVGEKFGRVLDVIDYEKILGTYHIDNHNG